MLPASFALTVLLSAWVLASARKFRFSASAVTAWTLGTLFFPLITLPLYLIARSSRRRRLKRSESEAVDDSSQTSADEERALTPMRRTLPLLYLMVMMSLGALYFYMDWKSVDAHLARANQARVSNQPERVIAEYRRALKLEDNAHTRNLLGRELIAARRWEEALAELQTAERMGERDDELPYNIAEALYNLNRRAEAKTEYERFLNGPLCQRNPPDNRCIASRERFIEIEEGKSR